MLTRKDMVKAQKMLDYIEIYEELLNQIEEYFARSITETTATRKRLFRKLTDETGVALQQVTERALNDNKIGS